MNTKLKHHEVAAEWVDDEYGQAIMLTQQDGWGDDPQTTIVHPWQLRSICEHFKVLPASSLQAHRKLHTMARRLNGLKDRINTLCEYMANHSDHKHADLSFEMVTVNALADLATEWCADLEIELEEDAPQEATPAESAPRSSCAPANGSACQMELA